MMRKGEAARALGISIMASTIGAFIGGLVSITSAPMIAKVALRFSPVEICIVVIFGLAIIGQVSSGGLAKGLLAGFFGLLLATTGTDPIWGTFRQTFGITYLIDGLPLIPVLIGLLALSELFIIIQKEASETRITEQIHVGFQGILKGFKDVLIRPVIIFVSGVIGLFVGAVPGAGSSIASFVSYQQAASFSKPEDKAQFGKGSPAGLMSADVANNSMVGGSLIPLLTLGIPGSSSMAVLMVVMGYHGLALGPRLFTLNGNIAYAVLWSQFAASVGILVIGTLLANFAYRVAYIRVGIIIPVVAILCIIGSFAANGYTFDIAVALCFGVLGYLMKRCNYPPVATLLGIILGPIFEGSFFRALKLGLGSPAIFFSRPLANILWALLIISFFIPPLVRYVKQRRSRLGE
jgi:putative tricarboxylic transport membrane protein